MKTFIEWAAKDENYPMRSFQSWMDRLQILDDALINHPCFGECGGVCVICEDVGYTPEMYRQDVNAREDVVDPGLTEEDYGDEGII